MPRQRSPVVYKEIKSFNMQKTSVVNYYRKDISKAQLFLKLKHLQGSVNFEVISNKNTTRRQEPNYAVLIKVVRLIALHVFQITNRYLSQQLSLAKLQHLFIVVVWKLAYFLGDGRKVTLSLLTKKVTSKTFKIIT